MKELMKKVSNFEMKSIDHPEGKKSKATGKVIKVTLYCLGDQEYTTADVITLKVGKEKLRFLIDDLTDDELTQVKVLKGEQVLREIMTTAHQLAKKINNTAKSAGVILHNERRVATNDFIRNHIATALDSLMNVKAEKEGVKLPF